MHAFKLGLWTKKDIDLFRYNEKQYELTGDATGSIAAKVGTTMILYYSFLFCDKTRNSEPLANIKYLPILTMSCQYDIVWINSLWMKREILAIIPTRCHSFLHVICCDRFLNLLSLVSIMNLFKNIFLGLTVSVMDVLRH